MVFPALISNGGLGGDYPSVALPGINFSPRLKFSIEYNKKATLRRVTSSLYSNGGLGGARTRDLGLKRALLYLLSYQSIG